MDLRFRIVNLGLALVAIAATPLLILSCSSKNPTAVDPSYSTPEGTASGQTKLILWPEIPVVGKVYLDKSPIGPDPDDEFVGFESNQQYSDGTINGLLLDGTAASAFQILRREPNGGLLPLADYTLDPQRRWLDKHWDAFQFQDGRPPTATPEYIARGFLNGAATETSPLSNVATSNGAPITDLPLTFPTDTTATWSAVPGAAYYLSHIYLFRQAGEQDRLRAGQPMGLYVGASLDFFVGISTQPTIVGHAQPFQGLRLTDRTMIPGTYQVHVSAIDALGQVIASTQGDSDIVTREDGYMRYPSGGYILPRPIIFHGPTLARARPKR